MRPELPARNDQDQAGNTEPSCCKAPADTDQSVPSACCGGPAPAEADACCRQDAEAKAAGGSGCGGGSAQDTANRQAKNP